MKHIYVIIDGLSETKGDFTSLEKATTPIIDGLFTNSKDFGFYQPEKALFHNEPKTDVIVPAFFGLKKELNPGRAALEIIDMGYQLQPNSICLGLSTTSDIDLFNSDFLADLKVNLKSDAIITTSNATNTGEKILFGNLQTDQIEILYDIIGQNFKVINNNINVTDIGVVTNGFVNIDGLIKDGIFLGWGKGALRGALKHLGFKCNPFERDRNEYFNWRSYETNFKNWIIPTLRDKNNTTDTLIFYTKESAFACRQNKPDKKIQAIEMMDLFLGKILKEINEPVLVILLADHSSNFGESGNPAENTIFLISEYYNGSIKTTTSHFHENSPLVREKTTISQRELIVKLIN